MVAVRPAMMPPVESLLAVRFEMDRRQEAHALTHCERDGIRVAAHPHCRSCGILMGTGHLEPESPDGLCQACGCPDDPEPA